MWFRHGQLDVPMVGEWRPTMSAVTLGFVLNAMVHVLQLGWGWDQKHPLRPWPGSPTLRQPSAMRVVCHGSA